MKYAGTLEFTSQYEPAIPVSGNLSTARKTIKAWLGSFFSPRFDPTRMAKAERRAAGIMECEIEWYKAVHGPLIK